MTWDAYHRRKETLREVLAVADRRRDGDMMWNERDDVRGTFATPDDLLLDIQMYWFQRLSGHLDSSFGIDDADPETAVVRAWRETAAELAGARAILDRHDDNPLLAKAHAKELGSMAHAAGLAPLGDPRGTSLGERLRTEARAIVIDRQRPVSAEPTWLARLRGALAT